MFKSIRSLKTELSSCLRQVQKGEECLIMLHRTVIAKIIPVQSPIEADDLNRKNLVSELMDNLIQPKKEGLALSKIVIKQRQRERY